MIRIGAALTAILLGGCAAHAESSAKATATLEPYAAPTPPPDPAPHPAEGALLIRNATVMTAAGNIWSPGFVLVEKGRIAAAGPGDSPAPPGARVIDGTGKFVTPGLIDTHSHIGVYSMPESTGNSDGNEAVRPVTADVWSEHGIWPQDPAIPRAVAGGITTMQVLPGSANLMGGRSVVVKLRPQISARAMRFPGAPQGLKMACGENPKRVYGEKGGPQTRMGDVAGDRETFQKALEYRRARERWSLELAAWKAGPHHPGPDGKPDLPPDPPPRDFTLETLSLVLDGTILVHVHCYRADEMNLMLDMAHEFGFHIRSFHHGLEAYKLADRLAAENVSVSTWSDWWGFKMEAWDGIPQNLAILTKHGVRAIVHSDSNREIRHLNQEAAKGVASGKRIGIDITDDQALRWLTANPAWALGIDSQVGTIEKGKMADLVVWDRSPFSVYSRTSYVIIDGEVVHDGSVPDRPTDFEIDFRGVKP